MILSSLPLKTARRVSRGTAGAGVGVGRRGGPRQQNPHVTPGASILPEILECTLCEYGAPFVLPIVRPTMRQSLRGPHRSSAFQFCSAHRASTQREQPRSTIISAFCSAEIFLRYTVCLNATRSGAGTSCKRQRFTAIDNRCRDQCGQHFKTLNTGESAQKRHVLKPNRRPGPRTSASCWKSRGHMSDWQSSLRTTKF
jgi:hypothetical protein